MLFKIGRSMHKQIEGMEAMAKMLNGAKCKHWKICGDNSVAMAVHLLKTGNIIAIPTDTIYGFAGLAENPASSLRLYEIKERCHLKPFAVCLSNISEIEKWAIVDNIPAGLLENILPGAVTVLLQRKPGVHEHLNPGVPNVGIRIPASDFVIKVAELAGPLVLTSANVSNEPCSVKPEEFCGLWPKLGGIFHAQLPKQLEIRCKRSKLGSTIVDLTVPGQYHIIRYGKTARYIITALRSFQLKPRLALTMQENENVDTVKAEQIC